MMHVYQRFKLRNLSSLEIDTSALFQIAAPQTPEPVREEALLAGAFPSALARPCFGLPPSAPAESR